MPRHTFTQTGYVMYVWAIIILTFWGDFREMEWDVATLWLLRGLIGVRDQFRLGGGGGADVSCPNIFSIACPKIKWFARILHDFFFCPKIAIQLKNSREDCSPQPPRARLVRQMRGLHVRDSH